MPYKISTFMKLESKRSFYFTMYTTLLFYHFTKYFSLIICTLTNYMCLYFYRLFRNFVHIAI